MDARDLDARGRASCNFLGAARAWLRASLRSRCRPGRSIISLEDLALATRADASECDGQFLRVACPTGAAHARRRAGSCGRGVAMKAIVVGLTVVGMMASTVGAEPQRIDPRMAIERSQASIGRSLGNHHLVDSTGAALPLASLRGKPLVISLVYTSCGSVCPPTTQHLIEAVEQAANLIGSDRFTVLTVGFDARNDTPARLTQFANIQGIKFRNWRIAGADPTTIEAVLRDLGFSYTAVAGGFD